MSPRSGMRRDADGPLVRRAVDGCIDSFAALLARHQVPVAHFVRQTLGGCDADVDDVVQEVFLRAHRRLADYELQRMGGSAGPDYVLPGVPA